jgi:hypothetical protein
MKRTAREEWDKITSKLGISRFVAQYQIQIYHIFIILSSPQCRIINFGKLPNPLYSPHADGHLRRRRFLRFEFHLHHRSGATRCKPFRPLQVDFGSVLRRPIETAALTRDVEG